MKKFRLAAALSALMLFAWTNVQAQQSANTARGFDAGKLYQFFDLDSVNVFNGNLNVQIPLGLKYPNGGGMTYGLSLVYNSKLWDYADAQGPQDHLGEGFREFSLPVPSHSSNAGFGWTVSLGRLVAANEPQKDRYIFSSNGTSTTTPGCTAPSCSTSWFYEDPSGAEHEFLPRAVSYDPLVTEGLYSEDDAPLRMRKIGTTAVEIDFPDGSVHRFEPQPPNGRFLLTSMRDAFGNTVTVSYAEANVWVITDAYARVTRVEFLKSTASAQQNFQHVLSRIVFPAPSAVDPTTRNLTPRTAEIVFHYEDEDTDILKEVSRGCAVWMPDYVPTTVLAPRLQEVVFPDTDANGVQSRYRFTYLNAASENGTCDQAALTSMVLPTGGKVIWEHKRVFSMPTTTCAAWGWSTSVGVSKRTFINRPDGAGASSGSDESVWSYAATLFNAPKCDLSCGSAIIACPAEDPSQPGLCLQTKAKRDMMVTVTSPEGNKVEHYFTIVPNDSAYNEGACADISGEYGLPMSHMEKRTLTDGSDVFLSTKVYKCAAGTCDASPIRTTYLRYEKAPSDPNSLFPVARVKADLTLFNQDGDRWVETIRSDFDGFGHYRTETHSSNFGVVDVNGNSTGTVVPRVTTTDFNPGSSARGYIGNAFAFSQTAPWFLGRFTTQTVTEGNETLTTKVCMEAANGFVSKRRVIRNTAGAAADGDIVSEFDRNTRGEIAGEHWGTATPGSTEVCAPTYVEQYSLTHEYQSGVLRRSQYNNVISKTSPEQHITPFATVDVRPDPATGLVLESTDSAGVRTDFDFDLVGRATRIREAAQATAAGVTDYVYKNRSGSTPASVDMIRRDRSLNELARTSYKYDFVGRLSQESRSMPDGTTSVRGTEYDLEGRPKYVYEWGTGTPATDRTAFQYDSLGRATTVTAPDGQVARTEYTNSGVREVKKTLSVGRILNGTNQVQLQDTTTREIYDGDGRLLAVGELSGLNDAETVTRYTYDAGGKLATVHSGIQTRTFTYDAAGLLLREEHPEVSSIVYRSYDGRGHAGERATGALENPRLTFTYDAAERLRLVMNGRTGESLQEMTFDHAADSGYPDQPGRLMKAVRHNRLANLGDYPVTTFLNYDTAGRVSEKKTVVSDGTTGRTFTQGFSYNDLSLPSSVSYPTCSNCGVSLLTRDLPLTYASGVLTGVGTFTPANGITYHPSGLLKSVRHVSKFAVNGVLETHDRDPHVGSRIAQIHFDGWKTCQPPSTPNITAPAQVCPSSSGNSASATSSPGVTFHWTITNGTITSGVDSAAITFSASGSSPITLTVTAFDGCFSSATRNVGIKTVPTAVVSGGGAYSGTPVEIRATLTGTGPWQVKWSDRPSPDVVTATPVIRQVSPATTTTYTVTSLSDANCTGTSSGSATVTVTPPPPPPQNVSATTSGNLAVHIGWSLVSGASGYKVERATLRTGPFTPLPATYTTPYADDSVPSSSTPVAYVYRVLAIGPGGLSAPSNLDYAVTATQLFTDDPINPPFTNGGTWIMARHIRELRSAIDALRASVGLAAVWTPASPLNAVITTADVTSLFAPLNAARHEYAQSDFAYSSGVSAPALLADIQRRHIQELRDALK